MSRLTDRLDNLINSPMNKPLVKKAPTSAVKKPRAKSRPSAWDKQVAKVKRLTLAAKTANDNLRTATLALKAMPVGK